MPLANSPAITQQRVKRSPACLQQAIERRGRPLSKLTREDWFGIAVEIAQALADLRALLREDADKRPRAGIVGSAFDLSELSAQRSADSAAPARRQRGRPITVTNDKKRAFVEAVDRARGKGTSADQKTVRQVLREHAQRLFVGRTATEIERLVQRAEKRASRWRAELSGKSK